MTCSRNCLMSNSSDMKEKYFLQYESLPRCVNEGCDKYVSIREWKYWSFKSECGRCSKARKLGKTLQGVIIHKKKYCENRDSHLGFDCPVPKDFNNWGDFKMALDMDHINGNRVDNRTENVKTYCKLCHYRKTNESGDTNRWKESSYRIEGSINKPKNTHNNLFW